MDQRPRVPGGRTEGDVWELFAGIWAGKSRRSISLHELGERLDRSGLFDSPAPKDPQALFEALQRGDLLAWLDDLWDIIRIQAFFGFLQ
jgi:hypothetical protein